MSEQLSLFAPPAPEPPNPGQRERDQVTLLWDWIRRNVVGSDRCEPGPPPAWAALLLLELVRGILREWPDEPLRSSGAAGKLVDGRRSDAR